jgi:hypothetical protein
MVEDTAVKPKIRLLHCHTCGTLEELPDFDGPPEYDTLLTVLLERHQTNGHPHIGKLYDVEERVWKLQNLRETIIAQIKGGGSPGMAAIDPEFYNTRDTFKEDAGMCFDLHLRPAGACHDWRSDRKKLVPNTKAERKDVGLDMSRAPVRYLCDFCPVRAFYEKKSRD